MTINTTKGLIEEDQLEKREGLIDNAVEKTIWVEYWLEGELVHRSVDMTLKQMPVFADGTAAIF